jgi:hypothetical protein
VKLLETAAAVTEQSIGKVDSREEAVKKSGVEEGGGDVREVAVREGEGEEEEEEVDEGGLTPLIVRSGILGKAGEILKGRPSMTQFSRKSYR